jgi:hypothetical protein
MEDWIPDDYESGCGWYPDEIQEANGIAFLLASWAYLTLADAYLRREGATGHALMDEIDNGVRSALRRFVTETPQGAARPDIILMAARKVRAMIEAGRAAPPQDRNVH